MTICAGRLPFVSQRHPPPGSPPRRATCMDPAVSRVPPDVTLDSRVLLAPGGCGRWEGSRSGRSFSGLLPAGAQQPSCVPLYKAGPGSPRPWAVFPGSVVRSLPATSYCQGLRSGLWFSCTLPSK